MRAACESARCLIIGDQTHESETHDDDDDDGELLDSLLEAQSDERRSSADSDRLSPLHLIRGRSLPLPSPLFPPFPIASS